MKNMDELKKRTVECLKESIYMEDFPGKTVDEAIEIILTTKKALEVWIETYEWDINLIKDDRYMDDLRHEFEDAVIYMKHLLDQF